MAMPWRAGSPVGPLAISSQDGDKLVSASAPGTASAVQIAGGSVRVPAAVPVDLTGPVPQMVLAGLANPLQGGDLVKLNLTFAEAGTIAMTVPVEPRAYEYATYSPPPSPSPTAKPKPSSTVVRPGPSGSASASVKGTPSTATPSP
jgi:hypothetical protein